MHQGDNPGTARPQGPVLRIFPALLPGFGLYMAGAKRIILNTLRAGSLSAALCAWIGPALGQTLIMADGAAWNTCSGQFYDSGGSGGNYGNSENMTATICPAGGSGSGPATSVSFLSWNVQLGGLLDVLTIHDGPSSSDPVLATGSGLIPLNGTYTATNPSGCLTFVWTSDLAITQAGWVAQVTTGPSAGTSAALTVCSAATAFSMNASLGGSPDAGGTWAGPGGAHSSTFNPASDPGGVYTYTVAGTGSCPDSSATLAITRIVAPDAGSNGTLSVCETGAEVALISSLGGTPDAGGTWVGPGGAHDGTYDPATDGPGVYTYTVPGTAPCANATATVTVTENTQPDAGINASTSICSDAAPFSLFALLGGSPDAGGAWTLSGAPVSNTFTPGTSVAGVYTYTVNAVPPCVNANATVTVSQTTAPNPGLTNSITVCSDAASFPMIGQLLGSPVAGGTWTGPLGAHGPNFNPAVDQSGAYTYTLTGTAPCTTKTAVLNVTVRQAPNAGTNGSITLCSTDANVQLITVLGGSPDGNGTWAAPGGGAHSGTFDPGVSTPGTYVYTVPGQAPCVDDVATVTVTVNNAPNAGTSGSLVVCADAANVNLFNQLGGSPNAGGTWSGPSVLTGGVFDPGVSLPGVYTYTVAGLAPCANASATVTVSVIAPPNAGGNGTVTVCSIDASFDLFSKLTGTPDAGGTWTAPGGATHNATFVPGTDPGGVWTYTVLATAPCANDVATVTVTVRTAPDAGTNGSVTLCSTDPPETLFNHLGGTPNTGGTWIKPNGIAFAGVYNPANVNHMTGVYTYVVTGQAPCPDASATVLVTENPAPNAGNNVTVTKCSTDGSFNLFSVLTGSPNATGSWLNPANAPFTNPFVPGTSTPGVYKYIVPGLAPCVNDTSFVTVVVNTAPDAGSSGTLSICSSGTPLAMLDSLGGSPDAGGAWTGPSPTTGTYNPATMVPGVYTYTVDGAAPCVDASATLTVSENQQPDAGANGMEQLCSTDPPFQLFNELGGSPMPGGTWSGPSPTSGTYDPATMSAGIYTYTVLGVVPCTNDQATVTVIENAAPYAGQNGTITICEGSGVVDLFNGLGPVYDPGGNWTDDDGTGQLSGSFFNPTGMPPGTYDFTYHLGGGGPCGGDEAEVHVVIVSQLNAGSDGTSTVCGDEDHLNLFSCIGGGAQTGGVWIDLDATGAVSGNFFNATLVPPDVYHFKYKLTGTLSCAADSSLATVTVIAPPNAGTDAVLSICSNQPGVNMFTLLGTGAQSGGNWSFGGPHSNIYNPLTDVSGVYTYTRSGTPPCGADQATVTVTEVPAPNAGTSNAISVCSNGSAVNMTSQLLGTPATTGIWTNPLGQVHSAVFVPGFDPPGCYTYTVSANSPCVPAVATLCITVNTAPEAGGNASLTVCSDGAPEVLSDFLVGENGGGSWTGPGGAFSGVYIPSTDSAGVYTYTVNGLTPCAAAQSTVTVFENEAPDAGTSASVTLCTNGGAVNLFSQLNGTPDPTGVWTFGGNAHSGIFIPGTSTAGCYTYTVAGVTPCTNATSTVCVTVTAPPNAGTSANVIVCSNQIAFALFDKLGGTPQPGGSWTGPGGSSGIFIPGTTAPGTYTYTVSGTAPCSAASATVTVTVNTAPYAGVDGSVTLCNTSGAINLFAQLTGGPQTGGTWSNVNGAHPSIFVPGVDPEGVYTYTVAGVAPCTSDIATVTVVVNDQPDAGSNGTITVCSDDAPFALFDELNGTPGGGGTWKDPSNVTHNGIYIPGVSDPGVYTYTITGSAPCANDAATVTVIENALPDAGSPNVLSVCSDELPFQLIDELLGTPDVGGSWVGPGGAFPGTYVPGSSAPGIYTYTVAGLSPCPSASAAVTILENTAPDAGISTAVPVCDDTAPFPLIDLLAGTPDAGGSWTGPGGPHLGIFDPDVDASGTYIYNVTGSAPCSDATSSVQVTLVPAANAGTNGTVAACVDDPSIDLSLGLGGSPDAGGTWSNDDGAGVLSGGVLDATGVPPGSYQFTYTVPGMSPCSDNNATVTLNITNALDAGQDATIDVCDSEDEVDLFAALGGTPQSGGNWIDADNSGALDDGAFDATQVAAGTTWEFIYILSASADCLRDSAVVTVNVLNGPSAGDNGSLQLCSNSSQINLGTPINGDAGGQWFDPSLVPFTPAVFDPASDDPGVYVYVVPAIGSCAADTAYLTIGVTPAPNAGSDGTLTICSNDDPVLLAASLGGTPDPGGSWFFGPSLIPTDNIYNPAVDASGIYRYVVQGTLGCSNAVAIVNVTENAAANAGTGGAIAACTDEASFQMLPLLGGAPQGGGTWYAPDGSLHGPSFDPAVDDNGEYEYIVTGLPGCENDTALLFVDVSTAPDPGTGITLSACITESCVDLVTGLTGTPDAGGVWQDLDGTGALFGTCFNATLVTNGTYHFQYRVAGTAPCESDSTVVTVDVGAGASAGNDSTVTICGGITDYNLFQGLGGDPDSGGTWSDDLGTGAQVDSILNASLLPEGSPFPFTYTINDPGCGDVSATVLVTTTAYPDPGADSTAALCSTGNTMPLFALLAGDPASGGSWTDPNNNAYPSGVFEPGVSLPGTYTYLIPGISPCPDSSATVTVVVNDPPDAGSDGLLLACDTVTALDLFPGLGGTPDAGGSWSDLDGTGALTAGTLNTTGLLPDDYDFAYVVTVPGCGADQALVKVTVVDGVQVSDTLLVCDEQYHTYTVSFVISGGDPGTYVVSGIPGTISTVAPFIFLSEPLIDAQIATILVNDQYGCGPVAMTLTSPCVFEDDVFVPESFSPNGDGVNETFFIPGIEGYPENSMHIFNRWGDEVFSAVGYDNRTRVWDGASQNPLLPGDLPTGTYYYVLDLGGGAEVRKGFIYLNR